MEHWVAWLGGVVLAAILATMIIVTTSIVSHNGTERMKACLETNTVLECGAVL